MPACEASVSFFRPRVVPVGSIMMDVNLSPPSLRRRSDHPAADPGTAPAFVARVGTLDRLSREQTVFDILNTSGKMAHGIEIELLGIGTNDVFHAFYLNRYGAPGVARSPNTILLRFESLWRTGASTLSLTRHVCTAVAISRPYVWEIALLGGGGSERLCLEISTRDVVATYRWLVKKDDTGGSLVAEIAPAFIHDARAWVA